MKLHRFCDVTPNPAAGLVCRQSRLARVVTAVLFSAILGGLPIYSFWSGEHRIFGTLVALFAALLIPLMIGSARTAFRSTNWLAWICEDGLWLNVRSFGDVSPTDAISVVQIDYDEIASVGKHIEKYVLPKGDQKGRSIRQKLVSLDICLKEAATDDLAAAIKANRHREQPTRTWLGFIKSTPVLSQFPVSLPVPNRIRVTWLGLYGDVASPALRRVLAELVRHVAVDDPTRQAVLNYLQADDAELSRLILRMVETGNTGSAIDLLKARRKMTTTEANQFIDELARQI